MCEHLRCLAQSPWHLCWARAVWGGKCWILATVNENCWPREGHGLFWSGHGTQESQGGWGEG